MESRNVFYFLEKFLYKPGRVWEKERSLSREPTMGRFGVRTHLATTKTGHDLYPMETGGEGFGFYLVFLSNVLDEWSRGWEGYVIFVYNLMRCVWKRTF